MPEPAHGGSLRLRLTAAFVGTAIAAVAVLALLIVFTTRSETGTLSAQARAQVADQVTRVLADAYGRAGSWSTADTSGAVVVARGADASLILTGSGGRRILGPNGSGPGRGSGGARGGDAALVTRAIVVAGKRVGTVELRFRNRLAQADAALRRHLDTAVLIGSLIAIAIALIGAALVARVVTRPLRRLIAAARGVRSGELSARSTAADAPGELGELSAAFDQMAQTLQEEYESRRRLVSTLAHEFRTPIAILQGNLEEMVDQVVEPTPERLGSLHEEVIRLGTLVSDLDALAYAGAPMSALEMTAFDLSTLVVTQLDALAPQLAAKGLRLERALSEASVRGDRARIGQVVANLLSNAVKFTPEGGTITVRTEAVAGGGQLSVSDSGPGIPESERERVFQWFWRGSAAHSVSGRGIGLAVAATIVHAHHGEISVASADGGGARFSVTLPAG